MDKLLPSGDRKDCAVVMKALMASVAFVEVIVKGVTTLSETSSEKVNSSGGGSGTANDPPSNGSSTKDKGELVESIFDEVVTVLDFGFSYVFGYHCYSPMDPDEDESDYSKKLATVKLFSEIYTGCWWFKSSISVFGGILDIAGVVNGKKLDNTFSKAAIFSKIVLYAVSFIAELAGDISAGSVNADNSSCSDEDIDKKVYLCDTSGYIFDDVRGILDEVRELLKLQGKELKGKVFVVYIILREVLATGYGISMALSGSYIRNA
jgi:hypothetical protein